MIDAGHVVEQRGDLVPFPRELVVVGEVLVLASTTGAEKGANGGDPIRAGPEDLDEIGVGAVLVIAPDADADVLAGEGERDEDHPAIAMRMVIVVRWFAAVWQNDAGDAGPEVGEGIDGDFEFLVVVEGGGAKLSGWDGHALEVALVWICE